MITKCVTLLLPLFIILPILEAYSFHGYNSYREYYKYRVKGVNLTMISKMAEQPNYEENDVQVGKHFDESDSHQAGFESDFIYPDDERLQNGDSNNYEQVETRISEDTLRCGDGQPFCEKIPHYPEELVDRILAENPHLYAYAFEDAVPIGVRLDSFDDAPELCLYTERIIVWEAAKSINGEWLLIVQSKKMNFRQRIHIELCDDPDTACLIIEDHLPEGYYSRCEQKYVYRQLAAINISNQEVVHEYFAFPANCCCKLFFNVSIKGQN